MGNAAALLVLGMEGRGEKCRVAMEIASLELLLCSSGHPTPRNFAERNSTSPLYHPVHKPDAALLTQVGAPGTAHLFGAKRCARG